jgi:hypothetical protein
MVASSRIPKSSAELVCRRTAYPQGGGRRRFNKRKYAQGVHYGHVLTSKVADCIKPPPALGHPQKKEKDKTSPTTTGRPKSTRSCKRCEVLAQAVFKTSFCQSVPPTPPSTVRHVGPVAMLYWQSCEDVRPVCYINPSVHMRSYIQN